MIPAIPITWFFVQAIIKQLDFHLLSVNSDSTGRFIIVIQNLYFIRENNPLLPGDYKRSAVFIGVIQQRRNGIMNHNHSFAFNSYFKSCSLLWLYIGSSVVFGAC